VTLIAAIKRNLQPMMPDGLVARAEEQVMPEGDEEDGTATHRSRPAVAVTFEEATVASGVESPGAAAAAVAESVRVRMFTQPPVRRWVQVMDHRSGGRVVTEIEVLSPSNKGPGEGNKDYIGKLEAYQQTGVNIVEIDLIRSVGRGRLLVKHSDLAERYRTPCMAGIYRAEDSLYWQMFPIPLRRRLPTIPVPLRPSDAEVSLDLQLLIDTAYAEGAYGRYLQYSRPLDPPLSPDDAAWAAELLRSRA
jgi:hypothetical protein